MGNEITAILLWPRPAPLSDADPYLGTRYSTLILQHPDDGGWQGLGVPVLDPWRATELPALRETWEPVVVGTMVLMGFDTCRTWVEIADEEMARRDN